MAPQQGSDLEGHSMLSDVELSSSQDPEAAGFSRSSARPLAQAQEEADSLAYKPKLGSWRSGRTTAAALVVLLAAVLVLGGTLVAWSVRDSSSSSGSSVVSQAQNDAAQRGTAGGQAAHLQGQACDCGSQLTAAQESTSPALAACLAREAAALPAGAASRPASAPAAASSSDILAQFFVVGDWGTLADIQLGVAAQMGAYAEVLPPQFVISTGDNIYERGLQPPGPDGAPDPRFKQLFTDVYTHPGLQVPWHVVLGNHDYGTGTHLDGQDCKGGSHACFDTPLHQLDVRLLRVDPRWHCERSFTVTVGGGDVDIFFIDTNAFNWQEAFGGAVGWWESQLAELESRLARSSAPWRLLVGHHPVFSNAQHGDTKELIARLDPLLEKYGVQLYLAGHDHSLEHLYAPDTGAHYMVSGAGGKPPRGFPFGTNRSTFQHNGSGFTTVVVRRDRLDLQYLALGHAAPVYNISVPRVPSKNATFGFISVP